MRMFQMFKNLLRLFLDGAVAGLIYSFIGDLNFLPSLPLGITNAIVIGVLVLVIDYILHNLARL